MKITILLIAAVILSGCASIGVRQGYRNLNYGQTAAEELLILESTLLSGIQLSDVTLTRACTALSSAYSEPPATGFLNIAVVEDPAIIGTRKVNLRMKKVSLARVYDELCEQTNATWRVNRYIFLAPKPQNNKPDQATGQNP